ncbi:MAG: Asp-tRNA(Asn)/Glu-tRNA(Gln) amidotransferase subunit GatB [Gammaproteobacteria bacterium]|jgi:aspartyl-tRNA(Asn)/glutamyl-tRNA(Gln) amidotransferase subunit B
MSWEIVIGLEVHAQLATSSKIFSGSSTEYGAKANTQASAVDLALPGVLPVLNKRVLDLAIMLGLAIDGEIASESIFSRKNYFYPDSPKGYQISQYDKPIISKGQLKFVNNGEEKMINITRAHLEEDAGKSLHGEFERSTAIDLNRSGTPLLEIVSEPELRSAQDAVLYLKELHCLVRTLGICDGNMQEGSFRCDANVSVRKAEDPELGTRTEVKNLNSFRFVEKAINYEAARQIRVIEEGGVIKQETRLYDPEKNETRTMRSKEDAHDYRYFPDPDLLPITITAEHIARIAKDLPETPWNKRLRYLKDYGVSSEDAEILANSPETSVYFEACMRKSTLSPKLVTNWILGELSALVNKSSVTISKSPIVPERLVSVLKRIEDKTISGKTAKHLLGLMWDSSSSADQIIADEGLGQVSDNELLEKVISQTLTNFPSQVEEYKAGKLKILSFLVGHVMKQTKGKANPAMVKDLMEKHLRQSI